MGILQSNVLPGISELCKDIVVVFLPLLCQAGRIRHTAGCCHGWEGPGQTYWRVSRLGTACVVASPCALEPHTLLESPSLSPPAGALRFSPSIPDICRLQIECQNWTFYFTNWMFWLKSWTLLWKIVERIVTVKMTNIRYVSSQTFLIQQPMAIY